MAMPSLNKTDDTFLLRWTLAKKVGGLSVGFLLLILFTTGYLYRSISKIGGEVSDLTETEVPSIISANKIREQQLLQHLALERVLRLNLVRTDFGQTERKRVLDDFENRTRLTAEAIHNALQSAERSSRQNEEYRSLPEKFINLQKAQTDFENRARQLIGLVSGAKLDEAEKLSSEIESAADALSSNMDEIVTDIESYAKESGTSAENHEVAATNVSGGLGLASTAAGILFSLVFIGGLRKSVTGLSGMATHISEGNLQQEKLPIRTTDELGQLGLIFNDMLDSLRDNVSQSRAGAEALSAAVAQILASTKQQAAGTSEQAAAVQETTATMEEICQSGSQVSERARQVAAAAEATATATNVGIEAVQSANKVMDSIQEQSETVAENIVTLSEKTQLVGAIISTVNDIAEQSNLLALNAAIEAAAAGEHGRSFSVVASEIKNLANQAKEATGQVRSILGDIQKGINTSVMLTEEVVKRVESGKKQSDVADRTIRHMADSLNDSIQAFQQIIAATNQQQIGFEQVTQALKNIRQASDQTAVSTSQLETAATNLSALGVQLTKTVERYRL